MLDNNRVLRIGRTILRITADGQGSRLLQVDIFIQGNLDCSILDRRLDVAIISYRLLILVIGTIAANL